MIAMRHATDPPGSDLAALRAVVHGVVLTAEDHGYDDARRVPNATIDHRPDALVQVTGPADVAEVLRFARARSMSVSVRGGGQDVAGHAVAGDIVIDLSAVRGVRVSPSTRTAFVRAGSLWSDVDAATQAYGLAVPGGRISRTGVAGHTLGGGHGWLSPQHGLTCDNLVQVELVTAAGDLVTANVTSNADLFWAVRGGGGNFGVVTSFTFGLHPLAAEVLGGLVLYNLAEAPEVAATVAELCAADPAFAGAVVLLSAPPLPFVPGDLVGTPVVAVVPAWLGDPDRGRSFLRPLWDRLRPIAGWSEPMPYAVLQSRFDSVASQPVRQRWSGALLADPPVAVVELLCDAIAAAPNRRSAIVLAGLGAAVTREPAGGTAFAHRDKPWWLQLRAAWRNPAEDDANAAWVDDVAATVRDTGMHGVCLNCDTADQPAESAFDPDRLARLRRVKAAWDPDDVFRHGRHLRPKTD